MSLKDNFNQAVKEILRNDGLVGDDLTKEAKKKSELDRYIDSPEKKLNDSVSNSFEQNAANDKNNQAAFSQFTQFAKQNSSSNSSTANDENFQSNADAGNVPPPKQPSESPYYAGRKPDEKPYKETEEITVISRNTIIDGGIRSFANVNIDGNVKGDVKITKNLNVTGKIVGDVECNNSVLLGASMQGNIASKGQVQIDRDSLLLGDISAQYLDLNGKVKGNITVGGKAEFKTDSIILGNITASTITVLDGATIQGYVNTTFLQDSSSSVFPEAINVSE